MGDKGGIRLYIADEGNVGDKGGIVLYIADEGKGNTSPDGYQ